LVTGAVVLVTGVGLVTGAVVLVTGVGLVTGAVAFAIGAVVFAAGVLLPLVGAAALVTGVVLGVDGCAGTALVAAPLVADVFGGLGVDGAVVDVLPEAVGALAAGPAWPVAEVLGRLPVAEVVAPTAEERPSADAVEAPNAQRTAKQVRSARTPPRREDERAQRRVIAWRASDAQQMPPSGPASLSCSLPFPETCPKTFISNGDSRKFCRNVREMT
jgi:hypothetical protein